MSRAQRLARSSSAGSCHSAEGMDDPGGVPPRERVVGRPPPHRAPLREEHVLGRGRHDHVVGPGTEPIDGLIRQGVEVLGGPVVPVAGRIVEHALELGVGHLRDQLALMPEREHGGCHLARLGFRSGVDDQDREREPADQMLGDELLGRAGQVKDAPPPTSSGADAMKSR